jgi:hypothetical protein
MVDIIGLGLYRLAGVRPETAASEEQGLLVTQ